MLQRQHTLSLLIVVSIMLSPVSYYPPLHAATSWPDRQWPASAQAPMLRWANEIGKTPMSVSDLRVTFDMLFTEHLLLVVSAANARLANRMVDFQSTTTALDENNHAITAAMGSVYNQTVAAAFLPIWSGHVNSALEYATSFAQPDKNQQALVLAELTQFPQVFSAFLKAVNLPLRDDVIAPALVQYVNQLTEMIKALAVSDYPTAWAALQGACDAVDGLASTLAESLRDQFPERFDGSVTTPAANFHTKLITLLMKHAHIVVMVLDAALGHRQAEAEASATVLDQNAQALATLMGTVYGQTTASLLLARWRSHTDLWGEYTASVLTGDRSQKDRSLIKLLQATQELSTFLVNATPNLSQAGLNELWTSHVQSMVEIIDAQVTGEPTQVYVKLQQEYRQMVLIGDMLTTAVVAQFPQRFLETAPAATQAANTQEPAALATNPLQASSGLPIITKMAQFFQLPPPSMAAGLLRARLDNLLGEFVLLETSATEAILRNRQADASAAAFALDNNAVALAAFFRTLYGEQAKNDFLQHWRLQLDLFNAYTVSLTTQDLTRQAQAQADLDGFATDFGLFMNGLNPNLSVGVQIDLIHKQVQNLLVVIDSQARETPQDSGDQLTAYPDLQVAYGQVDQLGTAWAVGIAQQFPTRFTEDAQSAGADLWADLNLELGEYIYLIAKSTSAALRLRTVEFEAAAGAVDQNTQTLAAIIASVYGEQTAADFLRLWRRHIGIFIDYTLAKQKADERARTKALADLTQHVNDLSSFLHEISPALPLAMLTPLLKVNADNIIAIIDAAAKADYRTYYAAVHQRYNDMPLLADPLASAIITQFPDRFGSMTNVQTVVQ